MEKTFIDPSVFQILVLLFTGIMSIVIMLTKGSISSFAKQIKEWHDRHEVRLNNSDSVNINHEKRITENAKDIESNTAQDLLKSDAVARGVDRLESALEKVSTNVGELDKRVTNYMLQQNH